MKNEFGEGINGTCFKDHADAFLNDFSNTNGMLLVHGECTNTISGRRFGHCWLELHNTVMHVGKSEKIEVPKELYYAIGKVGDNIFKYTLKEAKELLYSSGHYGPWDLVTER